MSKTPHLVDTHGGADTADATRTSTRLVLAGLMLATFLSAMDSSIVATAMPSIVGILGGFQLYSWIFSIYLLTTTVTVPIYGKLADLYGRQRVLLFGITLFLVGSVLCGLAQSMLQLVAFRGIQGIGAGAILPISTTLLGDLYPVEQRARVQGVMGSVWGFSAVVGPTVGGLIVDNTSWRWIFLINLPAGALAIAFILLFLHEHLERRQHRIDYAGAVTIVVSTGALLVALTSGGREWAWLSAESLGLFILAAAALGAFVLIERRAAEPVLPLGLFRDRLIGVSNLAGLLIGGVLIGVVTYVPLFAQGVLGTSATVAGAVMATMSIGWPLAAAMSGRVMLRWGYRATAVLGSSLITLGMVLFYFVSSEAPALYLALCSFVVGAGLGFATNAFIIGIQNSVGWRVRGVATASNLFLRSLGAVIWVALLGSVVNTVLSGELAERGGASGRPSDLVNSLLDQAAHPIPAAALASIRAALASAVHSVFILELVTAVAALVVIFWMPRHRAER